VKTVVDGRRVLDASRFPESRFGLVGVG